MLLLLALACHPPSSSAPVYAVDVKPILDARCTACHSEGGLGGFALTDYASASARADSVASYAASGTMPPFRAASGCSAYSNDLRVPDDELAVLQDWADAGAPEGDGDDGTVVIGATTLSRTDLTLEVSEPYTPSTDERRCFLLPYAGGDTRVTGFLATPSGPADVRRVAAFAVGPEELAAYAALDDADTGAGWACDGGPGVVPTVDTPWIAAWTPGQTSGDLPSGTGVALRAGGAVGLQVDYHTSAPVPDQPAVALSLDPAATLATWLPLYDPAWLEPGGFTIPAGSTDAAFSYTAALGLDQAVLAVDVGMRADGASAGVQADPGCLVDLPVWDRNWKRSYTLATPLELAATDTVTLDCTFRNYGDTDVTWGDAPGDEICAAWLYSTAGP